MTPEQQLRLMRVNALGSLYYFIKVGLQRKRLTDSLHGPWCKSLEREHIKDVYELPRDHFKSTICSEGFPIWRVLPFSQQDEADFRTLGYDDAFIRFMQKMHRQDSRNLLVAENIGNAAKLGSRIAGHYQSGSIFRALFPEVLPDSSCTWSAYSLHHKRTQGAAPHGEGTFDFLGVGGALQSRHYDGILIQDDIVGRKAIESISIMDKTIEYHQLLPGAFENPDDALHENDEFVVGNRWGYTDLSAHIREHESWFNVVTHSALGGCCAIHPADQPIFPQEFSFDKLLRLKARLGTYHFSCQFLNNPAAPENADFKADWLNYYSLVEDKLGTKWIVHEAKNGVVRPDIKLERLAIGMTVDPNHSGNAGLGRCRHAIPVVGITSDNQWYLLDYFAEGSSYDKFYAKIYELAAKWKLRKCGVETVASQRYIKHHIETMNRLQGHTLRIIELKGEVEGPDGEMTRKKEWRIRNVLAPVFEGERLWVQHKHQDFISEYTTFPRGKYVDLLDAMAYIPQLTRLPVAYEEHVKRLMANQAGARDLGKSYSVGIN
jgi:hypothetical protein